MNRIIGFGMGAGLVLLSAVFAQQEKPVLKKVTGSEAKQAGKQETKKKQGPIKIEEVEEETREGNRSKQVPKRLKRKIEDLFDQLERWRSAPNGPGSGGSRILRKGSGESVRVEMGDKGVRVEIRTKVDGKEEVKEYEASSLEEFRRLHPDVARQYGIGEGGVRLFIDRDRQPMRRFFGDRNLQAELERMRKDMERWQRSFGPWRTPRFIPGPFRSNEERDTFDYLRPGVLGVQVQEVPPAVADYLDLAPGLGFLVQDVVPGTLAARAGIRPKDLVVAVAGSPVQGLASIKAALLAVPEGGKVEITVLRKGIRKVLTATTEKRGNKKQNIKVRRLKKI